MLDPRDRRLFVDAMRPPAGYTLDFAVGTTFSLDLIALLTVPLSFSLVDWEASAGEEGPDADPTALLEAVRRYAGRLAVFCQAGQISLPKRYHNLYGYLETAVVEVNAPRQGGVFHPKVWALRFTAAGGEPVKYRLLVMSRNLTFDRSWDTLLALDGEVARRQNGFSRNEPLYRFFAALPEMDGASMDEAKRGQVIQVADELRRVPFDRPADFAEDVLFHPLGLTGRRSWPFPEGRGRMLIVSPFLSDEILRDLTAGRRGSTLISRLDSLGALTPETNAAFESRYVLHEAASPEADDSVTATDEALSGLHAKLYVMDDGWNATLWTGSANATHAAFHSNVEFLAELRGKKSCCGVGAVLGEEGTGLIHLLQPVTDDCEETKVAAGEAEVLLARIRLDFVRAPLSAVVIPGSDTHHMVLNGGERLSLPAGVRITCWPMTLREESAAQVLFEDGTGRRLTFGPLSLEAITPFIAIQMDFDDASCRFVRCLPLEGDLPDRHSNILRLMLRSREQVLRYLLFLLAGDDEGLRSAILDAGGRAARGNSGAGSVLSLPLYESLVQALDRDPARLDQVAAVIEELSRTTEGRAMLPEGFEQVWAPIWAVRKEVAR